MTLTLNAEKRTKIGKVGSLREAGILPAVYYGHKKEAVPIQIKKADCIKAWKEAGESTVITINMDSAKIDALINDVDIDPVTGEPRHADFYVFEKGHKVEISVPIEFIGTSPAVKEKGAVLVKTLYELKIKAEPSNLPHQIDVDISSLIEFGDSLSAKDIKLPSGVELEENPEEIVASVAEPKEEVEEVATPVDLTQIEVEKKGKKEEDGENPEVSKQNLEEK